MDRILKMARVGAAILAGAACALPSVSFAANVSGAVWTSKADGTSVNANLYDDKNEVHLNGGPQNANGNGLPPGTYYFQVTNPSGSVLLSTDPIQCRKVNVVNGVISGAASSGTNPECKHSNGSYNSSNGSIPVQLMPYDDTPNVGGEYKLWLTPVDSYGGCDKSTWGFCNSDSKTDNFKVKVQHAYLIACKLSDLAPIGARDAGDIPLANWPMAATGVDSGGATDQEVTAVTSGPDGCVSFTITASTFPQPVTVREGALPGWIPTFIVDADGNPYSPPDGIVSATLTAGQTLKVYFGNRRDCTENCGDAPALLVTKTANPTYRMTWTIEKTVDRDDVKSSDPATFNYTVSVAHGEGTDFAVNGTITLTNPGGQAIEVTKLVDSISDGTQCTLDEQAPIVVAPASSRPVAYSCTYDAKPSGVLTNTATAEWKIVDGATTGTASGQAAFNFDGADVVDGEVTVTDTVAGTLGTVSFHDPSPVTFTYEKELAGVAGTCTTYDNRATASSTTSNSEMRITSDKSVQLCRGADLTVSKTATPAFKRTYHWTIDKAVDKTLVKQVGGSAVFNYTVNAAQTGFTDSDWVVSGKITVTNPNDWEAVTVDITDALDNGGTCTVVGGTSVVVAKSGSTSVDYSCAYATAPNPVSFTNTATASWNANVAATPKGSASGAADGSFGAPTTTVNKTINVTDTFNGSTTSLGTVTATDASPYATRTFAYARTIALPAWNCTSYDNTARIVETGLSATKSVTVCGPVRTGALTMGFWQNKNGQGIITGGSSTAGVCNSATWLRNYAPFQDLSATATCKAVGAYVTTVIKAANASGSSMNAMLKAQMLATALDVYFSDPALGGNKINAPSPIGSVGIDLAKICTDMTCNAFEDSSSVFGGTPKTVWEMLTYASSQSDAGGLTWYGNVKSTQELAKDAFDAINNEKVFAP